ncbi:hypothetical protein [Lederbergia ruris]|nr:hypothetical protein [Lederbergia ruris]
MASKRIAVTFISPHLEFTGIRIFKSLDEHTVWAFTLSKKNEYLASIWI